MGKDPSYRSERELLSDSCQSLFELIQTTACIDKFLLTGVEGVALGANVNTHLAALSGTGYKRLTARATNHALNILGMDSVFHFFVPHFEIPDML